MDISSRMRDTTTISWDVISFIMAEETPSDYSGHICYMRPLYLCVYICIYMHLNSVPAVDSGGSLNILAPATSGALCIYLGPIYVCVSPVDSRIKDQAV